MEERRKLIIAGKLVTSTEGALESTGAKNDLVVPAVTASSPKVATKEGVTRGRQLATSALVRQVPTLDVHILLHRQVHACKLFLFHLVL